MSVHYDLYENPDIKQTGEKQPLHARVVSKGSYSKKEFIQRVSIYQHLPHALLEGAIQAIGSELKDLLAQGYSVELGEIGHFSLSLKTDRRVMDKKELRSPSIHLKDVVFRVNRNFKRELSGQIELERTASSTRTDLKLSKEECINRLKAFLEKNQCINRADYATITGRSKIQAVRDLNEFIQDGIIRKYGTGRMVVYLKKG